MKNIFLVSILFLFAYSAVYSQTDSTAKSNDESFEEFEDFEEFEEFDFPFFKTTGYFERNIPTIELGYGMNNPNYNPDIYSGEFNSTASIDAKIGFTDFKKVSANESIQDYSFTFFFIENINNDYSGSDYIDAKLTADAWRFGLGNKGGYGWKLGKYQSISLYKSSAIAWTSLDFTGSPLENQKNAIDIFGDKFRFGSQFSAGVNVRLIKNIGIDASYERVQVFPRHMFWYWAGSELVEGLGTGLVSVFVNYVEESSPNLVPVVNFVLKNAISYGMYELRSEKMNWPFNTVAPLEFESFKIGLSFYL